VRMVRDCAPPPLPSSGLESTPVRSRKNIEVGRRRCNQDGRRRRFGGLRWGRPRVCCALALESAGKQSGLPLRAGLRTGEIELRGRDVGGIAVHTAACVMAHCVPGEVLASRGVTDLAAGASLKFVERGSHELKGLPGRWDLFSASL
jgi:hypothetical protein